MRYLVTGMLAIAMLCVANTSANAAIKDGDFASGWNTWKDAKKGDFVEYALAGMTKRVEVNEVKSGNITYTNSIIKAGKVLGDPKPRKPRTWQKIKVLAKIPKGNGISGVWSKEDYNSGDIKIKCDVYKYKQENGEVNGEIWFCKDVPCGGVVKVVGNGETAYSLTSFKSGESGDGGKANAKVVSELPKFYAKKGNFIVVKITRQGAEATYQKREIVGVQNKESTLKIFNNVNADGSLKAASEDSESSMTKENYDKSYSKPDEENVNIKVEAGEFKCSMFKKKYTKQTITTWMSEGIPIKEIMERGGKETVLEVVKISWAK